MAHNKSDRGAAVQQNGSFDLANLFKELPLIHFFLQIHSKCNSARSNGLKYFACFRISQERKNHKGFMKILADLQIFLLQTYAFKHTSKTFDQISAKCVGSCNCLGTGLLLPCIFFLCTWCFILQVFVGRIYLWDVLWPLSCSPLYRILTEFRHD